MQLIAASQSLHALGDSQPTWISHDRLRVYVSLRGWRVGALRVHALARPRRGASAACGPDAVQRREPHDLSVAGITLNPKP